MDRREDDRRGADHAKILRAKRDRQDALRLAGASIVAGNLAAIDDVGIERIGDDVAIFLRGDGMPFAERDCALIAATGDAERAALLLAAVEPIRNRVIRRDVIKLRGRLVIPRAPTLA